MKDFAKHALLASVIFGSFTKVSSKQAAIVSKDFRNPPVQNHIYAWWHWMTGYISKEGITKDLEAMKQQGIPSATILNVYRDIGKVNFPPIRFDSKQRYDAFLHALKEAKRWGWPVLPKLK